MLQRPGERLQIKVPRQFEQIGRPAQVLLVEPHWARGETAPQPMHAASQTGMSPSSCAGRKMLGVAQRGRILAMARNARRWRSAPANGGSALKTASSKASPAPAQKAASKPASAPTAGCLGGRAQVGNTRSNSGLVRAELGASSRRDRRRGKAMGAPPSGSVAAVSSSKGSAGSNRTMVLA
jgi:hypothetical protein